MIEREIHGIYGMPPSELVDVPERAVQFSPLSPGSERLSDHIDSLASMAMLAPPGTLERRHDIALALRALRPGGTLTVLAPKDKGGSRLAKEVAAFGCTISEQALRHQRIVNCLRPDQPSGLDAAIEAGAPRFNVALGLWSQPGIFSFDRIDRGTAFLLAHLPDLKGRGVDLGAGLGLLSKAALTHEAVTAVTLVDIDRRATDAAARNVTDPRATFMWADARQAGLLPAEVDFVLTNPPFHDGGAEDQALGQAFIRRAAAMLRKGGLCLLVANRHLPYEQTIRAAFARMTLRASAGGYKIYEAQA